MTDDKKTTAELEATIEELSRRLEDAEQTLDAITSGSVDAVMVSTPEGGKIFTLQGAEHPYRVLVETMNEGAVTLDADGTILYANSRMAAMLLLPLEKLIGSTLMSHMVREDRAALVNLLAKSLNHEARQELSLLTGEGQRVPVLLSCRGGEISGSSAISMVVTDISSRKQAERTILRLNRLYAVLSGTNHAIVHAGDRLSIFREFCRVAVEVGGFRLAWAGMLEEGSRALHIVASFGEVGYLDALGQRLDLDTQGIEPVAASIRDRSYYICNDFFSDDLTRPCAEQAEAHRLRAMASIAIKQDGEVVGALTLYADEKDFFDAQQVELLQQMGSEVSFALDKLHQTVLRNEAEQALQDETLERLRTVEELRRNEQMLVHQSRQAALGEMIGNIAHQWRQPLNALGLLVQQGPLYFSLGEVTQEYMEATAEKSMELIEHMSRTIDDFRNFFKPNKEKVVFSVKGEVTRTLSMMEGSFRAQQIKVDVRVEGDPEIDGYPNEFSQVLLNILINARDALAERRVAGPKVTITVGIENGRAVVTIADNAGGIPEEIMDKIFDPYFTTKGPQSGTGVGLFMSKTIIEKNMGGMLSARNTETGAEFRIVV